MLDPGDRVVIYDSNHRRTGTIELPWNGRVFVNPPYGTENGQSVAGQFCTKVRQLMFNSLSKMQTIEGAAARFAGSRAAARAVHEVLALHGGAAVAE